MALLYVMYLSKNIYYRQKSKATKLEVGEMRLH